MSRTAGSLTLGCVPFRVCLFFVKNPNEELLTQDIAVKCDADLRNIHRILAPARKAGWLDAKVGGGRGGQTVYTAGPALRALVGP